MAYDGMQWQVMNLPFRAGLMQTADDRARPQPFLDIAKDIAFDELGGIQTRLPFVNMSNAIFGGGTLANCRRLAVVNDELCVFTDVAMYSWNAQLSVWVSRATHLAVTVDEQPRFVTSGDQIDGDRAELNGTIVYAWTEAGQTFVSAIDKTTGSVLMAQSAPLSDTRPRLVALATKILLFVHDGVNNLFVVAIDPAAPSIAGPVAVLAGAANLYYDVVRAGTQDLCVGVVRRLVTTSYTVFSVTPTLTISTVVKAVTADGPVAIAAVPDGSLCQIVRGNGTNIQGDLIATLGLGTVFFNQAIGTAASTTINQIAVAFSSTTSARAFWTSGSVGENTIGATFEVKSNTVTTANVVGAQATFVMMAGIASRAFTYAGSVYIWVAFAQENIVTGLSGAVSVGVRAQVQNTYFLYRDDKLLISKSLFDVAGGHSASTGHLPGVAPTSATGLDFAWCGTRRRIIEVGGKAHEGFEARSPADVRFSFDSDLSRRSAALGRTLYIADGIPLQYDGVGLFEVGFLVFPYDFFVTTGGAGSIAAGDYVYKSTLAWANAQGEKERSTTAMGAKITAPGANKNAIQVSALNYTRKVAGSVPTVEVWRTAVAPPDDAPFFLVSGKDPGVLAGGGTNNAYVPNSVDAPFVPSTGFLVLNDSFADATLITKEKNPENGAVLESLAPPGASLILTTDTRVFLAGVPGDPDAVWYSRLRNEGEIASFHDGNRVLVPRPGGRITALTIHNETLTVFRETAVYRLPGEGINNAGGGSNFQALEVPGGVGAVSQESVASTQVGVVFKSSKGWYLLTPGWSVQFIGGAVSDYDSETVRAITHVDKQHQVRIVTSGRMIVWDYSAATEESPIGQWFEWTVGTAIHALMWAGQYVILTPTGPAIPRTTFTGGDFGMDVETAWIKLADLQGAAACRKVQPLGEIRSLDFLLWIRVAYNYKQTGGVPDYVDSKVWTPSPAVVGGPLQLKHGTKRLRAESIKVRLTAVAEGARATLLTTALAPQVPTSGTVWASTWRAAAAFPGELGNGLTMSVACVAVGALELGLPYNLPFTLPPGGPGASAILVRDHFAWSQSDAMWVPDINNVGVVVAGPVTVAELEAAIAAGSVLAMLSVADPAPTKTLAMVVDTTSTATFSGGTFVGPPGESLKLTGLGLEVGAERGLFNRLPASQSA